VYANRVVDGGISFAARVLYIIFGGRCVRPAAKRRILGFGSAGPYNSFSRTRIASICSILPVQMHLVAYHNLPSRCRVGDAQGLIPNCITVLQLSDRTFVPAGPFR
jgi:hypothetical protein